DPYLESICLKAIAKRVEDRYRSMEEMAQALGEYIRTARQGVPGASTSGSGSLSTTGVHSSVSPPVAPSGPGAQHAGAAQQVPAPPTDAVPEPFQRITTSTGDRHAVTSGGRPVSGRRSIEKATRRRVWPWVVGSLLGLLSVTGVLLALLWPRSV